MTEHPTDIPYRNNKGEIIGFCFISEEDYENVRKYNWTLKEKERSGGTKLQYLFSGYYDGKAISLNMHELIKGQPPDDHIIDHIDHNGINNRRENLRFATLSQNSQNRQKQPGTTSQYIGVTLLVKSTNMWKANFSRTYLGTFDNEKDAAQKYDTYVLVALGKDSQTNGFVQYEDVKNLTIEDVVPKKVERTLPLHISKTKHKFNVEVIYKKKVFRASENTLEDAIDALNILV